MTMTMDYGQYTPTSLSPGSVGHVRLPPQAQDDCDRQVVEPQGQDQQQDQVEMQDRVRDQGRELGHYLLQDRQLLQDGPQVQAQVLQGQQRQQGLQGQDQVQQLPQLDQHQLRQLHHQLEYFAHLSSSPQAQQLQLQQLQQASSSTPVLGFAAPPTSFSPDLQSAGAVPAASTSPWESPTSGFGGLTDAQFAVAMNMVASPGVGGVYGHPNQTHTSHVYGHPYTQSQQGNATMGLPPITTLEMVEATARDVESMTPGSARSASSGLPPTPASSASVMTASPVAVRNDFGGAMSDGQQQMTMSKSTPMQDGMQEEQEQDQEEIPAPAQYEPPRVIELVERPLRKSRAAARQQQATSKNKSATQAKVGVTHAQRQSQSQRQSGKQQQELRQSEAQVRQKTSKKQNQQASSSSTQQKPLLQLYATAPAKQAVPSDPNPPALVTNVPSPSEWYGIHALATASHQRVAGVAQSPSTSTPSPLGLHNVNGISVGKQPVKSATRDAAREAGHPYPPRLRQRRTVSGPAAFNASVGAGSTSREDDDVGNDGGDENGGAEDDAPSPSRSLPTRSPIPTSQNPPSAIAQTRFFSAPPPSHPNRHSETIQQPHAIAAAHSSGPRYLVRTDLHYDIPSNTLTAMLEIPGVPRAAIRIAVGTDARTGVRMIVVRGRMRRVVFPPSNSNPSKGKGKKGEESQEENEEAGGEVGNAGKMRDEEEGYVVKERKCGEFKRVLVVPEETKPEDIKVSMADGILFLRYPAGEQNPDSIGTGVGMGTFPAKLKTVVPNADASGAHTSSPSRPTLNANANPKPDSTTTSKPNSKSSDASSSAGTRSQASSRSPSKAPTPAPATAPPGTGGMQYNFRLQRVVNDAMGGTAGASNH